MQSHLVIPDAQVKPGVPTEHLKWAGEMIVDRRPDVVICLGDFWDMPSLSMYDTGTAEMEGRRYIEDIKSGNKAMNALLKPLKKLQAKQRHNKHKVYRPRMVFLMGNHEERILRFGNNNPAMSGYINYDTLNLKDWEVVQFKEIINIDGVHYSHYFYNPMNGRPYGGMIESRLKNVGFSFTQGHVQGLKYGQRELNNGTIINGLVAGSFYLHDEGYKGPQANEHWRGLVYKHDVHEGNYDIELLSMRLLESRYGGK